MEDNKVMEVSEVEVSKEKGSIADGALTVFCLAGSAVALGGVVKKGIKKIKKKLEDRKLEKETFPDEEE